MPSLPQNGWARVQHTSESGQHTARGNHWKGFRTEREAETTRGEGSGSDLGLDVPGWETEQQLFLPLSQHIGLCAHECASERQCWGACACPICSRMRHCRRTRWAFRVCASVRARARAQTCACVQACVRVCVYACVRVRVRVRDCARERAGTSVPVALWVAPGRCKCEQCK